MGLEYRVRSISPESLKKLSFFLSNFHLNETVCRTNDLATQSQGEARDI